MLASLKDQPTSHVVTVPDVLELGLASSACPESAPGLTCWSLAAKCQEIATVKMKMIHREVRNFRNRLLLPIANEGRHQRNIIFETHYHPKQ